MSISVTPRSTSSGAPKWLILVLVLLATTVWLGLNYEKPKRVLGSTVRVEVADTGIEFMARVDTGAAISSLHVGPLGLVIEDPSDSPEQNVGKPMRVLIRNRHGEEAWLEVTIEGAMVVRTAHGAATRYQITLPLTCDGVRKEVAVTLGERDRMRHALLLGRNFLSGDFVVDVSRDDRNPM